MIAGCGCRSQSNQLWAIILVDRERLPDAVQIGLAVSGAA
jgi:hypothetical protein